MNCMASDYGINSCPERPRHSPEWKKHEAALAGGMSRVRMDLADFLDDPENNVDPCWPLTPEERQTRREALGHLHQIESIAGSFFIGHHPVHEQVP